MQYIPSISYSHYWDNVIHLRDDAYSHTHNHTQPHTTAHIHRTLHYLTYTRILVYLRTRISTLYRAHATTHPHTHPPHRTLAHSHLTDHIAIPDFSAGAMENWGLTIYRETALLHDDQRSSSANKYWTSLVISHEIAHTVSQRGCTLRYGKRGREGAIQAG